MARDIWLENGELPVHSAVLIFFNKNAGQFLLEKRPLSNPTLGGEVVFPGEKGIGFNFLSTAKRGVREEMGSRVKILDYSILHQFSGQIGTWGQGIIQPIVVSRWEGQIKNIEPGKGVHLWTNRDEVMGKLTYDQSKYLFLMALGHLKLIKAEDFIQAPKIPLPTTF